jgi:N-acetylmuramoyl-L-alanine amidase
MLGLCRYRTLGLLVISSVFASLGTVAPGLRATTEMLGSRQSVESQSTATLPPRAAAIVARVRPIASSDLAATITQDPTGTREIGIIVLHHSVLPSASGYRKDSIPGLARLQIGTQRQRALSWHYAVGPDGSVWTGMPLAEEAQHLVAPNNETTVSVILILDGDREDMSRKQADALTHVLRALFTKLHLDFGASFRFHNEIEPERTCPGTRLDIMRIFAALKGRG